MELNEFTTNQFEPVGSVMFQISHSTGQCRKQCTKCHCLQRIIQGCVSRGIKVPPYDTAKKYPTPIFIMNEEQLYRLREYLLSQPEPEVW